MVSTSGAKWSDLQAMYKAMMILGLEHHFFTVSKQRQSLLALQED